MLGTDFRLLHLWKTSPALAQNLKFYWYPNFSLNYDVNGDFKLLLNLGSA